MSTVIYLLGALAALAFLALLAFGVFFARGARDEQRAIRMRLAALEAQLRRQHQEQRDHVDAAAAVTVAQLSALPSTARPRPVPAVEVRPAPPFHARPDETTQLSGVPRPRGAA